MCFWARKMFDQSTEFGSAVDGGVEVIGGDAIDVVDGAKAPWHKVIGDRLLTKDVRK